MDFELVGEITELKTIATGTGVRDRARLRRLYGRADGGKLRALLRCGYLMVGYAWPRFIGMKRTGLVRENSN